MATKKMLEIIEDVKTIAVKLNLEYAIKKSMVEPGSDRAIEGTTDTDIDEDGKMIEVPQVNSVVEEYVARQFFEYCAIEVMKIRWLKNGVSFHVPSTNTDDDDYSMPWHTLDHFELVYNDTAVITLFDNGKTKIKRKFADADLGQELHPKLPNWDQPGFLQVLINQVIDILIGIVEHQWIELKYKDISYRGQHYLREYFA